MIGAAAKSGMRSMLNRPLLAGAALACAAAVGASSFAVNAADAPKPAGAASSASLDAWSGAPQPVVRRLTEAQYRATIADIFGPDMPIVGRFERGLRHAGLLAVGTSHAGLSTFSLEQYFESAKGIAAEVVKPENRSKFISCTPASESSFDAKCAQDFIEQYGLMLFRRPVSAAEAQVYVKAAKEAHANLGGFYPAIQATLAGMLVSPDFLLRVERAVPDKANPGRYQLDSYSKAVRLSYLLTNSTPDAELLRAAGAGELETDAGLGRQADRLLASPKFERAVREVFSDMLALDGVAELSKDPEIFPAFNSNVLADAPEQTLRTIVDLLVKQRGDYRDIFTTRETYLTRPLGAIYRIPVTPRNGWEKVELPAEFGRAGILSHISFLAVQAHSGTSSATLRGKFIRQTFLCQPVPDPPPNVTTSLFDGPDAVHKTARLRLAEHNENPVCAGCHKLTDPLGLTLEKFDGAGGFRETENGAPIDVSGSLDGKEFEGAIALGQALRDSPQTSECFVQTLYQSAAGQENENGELVADLTKAFAEAGHRVPDLMRLIAINPAFYTVSKPQAVPELLKQNTALNARKGDKS